jgi:hypothetical protein
MLFDKIITQQDAFNQIKWKCVSVIFTFVCACGKINERKIILNLSLDLVKVGGCDFPHPCDSPLKSPRLFRGPSYGPALSRH